MSTTVRSAGFEAAFARLHSAERGREPAWLTHAREEAFSRCAARGLPGRDDELWRHTSVQPIEKTEFHTLPARVTTAGNSAAGAVVLTLTDALARDAERLKATMATPAELAELSPFALLAAALATDGVVVRVPDGVDVREPLELRHVADGSAQNAMHARIVVELGRGARLTLIETWSGVGVEPTFSNRLASLRLADGAALDHVTIVDEQTTAFHVATVHVDVARDARYSSVVATAGGRLIREDRSVRLSGEGAECRLDGLYFARGGEHVDHHTIIDHAVPRTTSAELYKGVLDGRARGVFNGSIIVRPGAQKTAAAQKNENLLLSDAALAHSMPRLEIHADDVQCRHGSTIGQLEGDPLFYLRSRGIAERDARDLLTFAFANEILARIPVAPVRERLLRRLFGAEFEGVVS